MKADWVVWFGVIFIFLAGVLWGGVNIPTNFFEIENVHDFFEVLSSVATVIGVGVALFSVNAWRGQKVSEYDHDLARRAVISLAKFKDVVRDTWIDASFLAGQVNSGQYPYSEYLYEKTHRKIFESNSYRENSKGELEAILLEIKAVWGENYLSDYSIIIGYFHICMDCISASLDCLNPNSSPLRKYAGLKIARSSIDCFTEKGWFCDSSHLYEKVNKLCDAAEVKLQEKLILRK